VRIRAIEAGDRVGQMWIINSGLQKSDRVVSEGTAKVADGTLVTPRPDPQAASTQQ